MRKTVLLELIRNGQNSKIVFQPDTLERRTFSKEIVALLNFQGGRVILGVDDGGSVVGIN